MPEEKTMNNRGLLPFRIGLLAAALVVASFSGSVLAITFEITTAVDSANPGDGVCSIREALIASELQFPSGNVPGECPAGTGVDTLDLSTIANQTMTIIAQPLVVATNLDITIIGANVKLDGNGAERILEINTGATVAIDDLTFQNGVTIDRGAGIKAANATLALSNAAFVSNTAGTKGGAIFAEGSDLSIETSFFSGNQAGALQPDELGGAIAVEGGSLAMNGNTVTNNSVPGGFGGGLSAVAADVSINQLTLTFNEAGAGGAMLLSLLTNQPVLERLIVTDNTADRAGGILLNGGAFELVRPTIRDNTASTGEGGGLVIIDATAAITGTVSTINGNESAQSSGGGIHATNSDLTIETAVIEDNRSAKSGAGIFLNSSQLTTTRTNFRQNQVKDVTEAGGGLHFDADSKATLSESNISGNRAAFGGGISLGAGSTVLLERSLVDTNSGVSGGAFAIDDAVLTLFNTTVSGNRADTGNVAKVGGDATLRLVHATVAGQAVLGEDLSLYFTGTGGRLEMTNSLVYTGPGFADCGFEVGAVVVVNLFGNNLVGEPGDCVFAGGGNLITADPMLEPLVDNGGRTATRKPMTGSPIIDAGDSSVLTMDEFWDQRNTGFGRDDGLATEIGAFELQGGRIRLDNSFVEVNEDAGFAEFTFERQFDSEGEVFITLNTQDDEATAPDDYTAIVDGKLTWAEGELGLKTVKVIIKEDLIAEAPEDLLLIGSGPTGGASLVASPQGTVRILDVPPPPGVFKDGFEVANPE